MASKRALITGVFGQDGSYLAEFLLERGYEVYGLARSLPASAPDWLRAIEADPRRSRRFNLLEGDLRDLPSLEAALAEARPSEIYNLAAQSHVGASYEDPIHTTDVVYLGALRLLEAARAAAPAARFFQASSAEMFGPNAASPQNEMTPLRPRSPYAIAKAAAHCATAAARERHGLFACCGILFNHESPRRGEGFVTRKITRAAAEIKLGRRAGLKLGNLEARRDWGFAGDYAEAMWLALQQTKPDDYVIATGEEHSVEEFLEAAFACAGLAWKQHVEFDPALMRPAEIASLRGDASKIRRKAGWRPKVDFKALVEMMVEADLRAAEAGGADSNEKAGALPESPGARPPVLG